MARNCSRSWSTALDGWGLSWMAGGLAGWLGAQLDGWGWFGSACGRNVSLGSETAAMVAPGSVAQARSLTSCPPGGTEERSKSAWPEAETVTGSPGSSPARPGDGTMPPPATAGRIVRRSR